MPMDEHELISGEAAVDDQFILHDMMTQAAQDERAAAMMAALRGAASASELMDMIGEALAYAEERLRA